MHGQPFILANNRMDKEKVLNKLGYNFDDYNLKALKIKVHL
jgi:hypothetical protein